MDKPLVERLHDQVALIRVLHRRSPEAALIEEAAKAIEELRDALTEARQALFHNAPVTVGLENQINAALSRAST